MMINPEFLPVCGCHCKADHICAMEFVDLPGYTECIADPGYTCTAAGLGPGMMHWVLSFVGMFALREVMGGVV